MDRKPTQQEADAAWAEVFAILYEVARRQAASKREEATAG